MIRVLSRCKCRWSVWRQVSAAAEGGRSARVVCGLCRWLLVLLPQLATSVPAQAATGGGADLVTPPMTDADPAPGKRVRQVAPEYVGTAVHHALYLPTNWRPGGNHPVIVEYTGNRSPAHGSTGEVAGANLGFGLTGGADFIWVTMPYVAAGRSRNAPVWWGDREATIEYCKINLPRICEAFAGDPDNVFLCGFSRGAIATSYIGLADDDIAALWKAVITHDHFDGDRQWGYPGSDRASALARLRRLRGRPVLACGIAAGFLRDHPGLAQLTVLEPRVGEIFDIPEAGITHPHTDRWMHRDSEWRARARAWLAAQLECGRRR